MTICEICKKREAVLTYHSDMLAFTHGWGKQICRECYIEKIKKEINSCKSNLKEQEKLLKEEKDKEDSC